MGLRGPAPTPAAILKARGTFREDRHGGMVEFPEGKPTCPAFLGREAKAEWKRQVRDLEVAGVLCEVDRAALTLWCEAWGEFVDLRRAIDRLLVPPAAPDENSPQGADLAALQQALGYAQAIDQGLMHAKQQAVARLLKLSQQFGFTPAARARLKAPERQQEQQQTVGKGRFFAG